MVSSRAAGRPLRAPLLARAALCVALTTTAAPAQSAPPSATATPSVAATAPAHRLPSRLPPRIDVRADLVGFYPYSDATLLGAEGHAVVRAGPRRIAADSVRIDLKTNRVIASGNVVVTGGHDRLDVAAYAVDLATGRAYAIVLEPLPKTLALANDNLSTAVEGPAPSDTFAAADLTGQRPYIESRHASITTNANIRMTPAQFPTSAGVKGMLPTFVYTFEYNQLFAQGQALPSTTIDYPYTLFGTPNSLTSLHARYDQYDGIDLGLDEHLVDGNREYFVASILPFRGHRFDLNASQTIRSGLTQNFTGTLGSNLAFGSYFMQETAREFSVRAAASAVNGENQESLSIGTLSHTIPHFFTYSLLAGYGYEHNPGQYLFTGDFYKNFSASVSPPGIHFPFHILGSTQYNYNVTKYDTPHLVTSSTETFTLSSPTIPLSHGGARNLAFFGSASIENDARRYGDDAAAFLGLPNPEEPYFAPDHTLDPGYFAYDGLDTLRTYTLISTYQAPHDLRFQLGITHAKDFPQGHGIGRAPLVVSGDLTLRLTSTLKAEISRSYAFGQIGDRFSQYSFSVSP